MPMQKSRDVIQISMEVKYTKRPLNVSQLNFEEGAKIIEVTNILKERPFVPKQQGESSRHEQSLAHVPVESGDSKIKQKREVQTNASVSSHSDTSPKPPKVKYVHEEMDVDKELEPANPSHLAIKGTRSLHLNLPEKKGRNIHEKEVKRNISEKINEVSTDTVSSVDEKEHPFVPKQQGESSRPEQSLTHVPVESGD
ncbi:hypothetical protein GH714_031767 [Hevea brasiliensis]|uniref:Uncharacterized protein n=1 Tax=Hevea brasiliensis TaxID=3981 RepID=A0A6A6L685_HEVBR|nr:hypothetical protein GH714_031767 [Hevea brasiliensis]